MAQNRRRFGDRKEGRLLRSLPGFSKFIPFIMPQRNDRFIHYEESFEITALDRRLRQLRVDGFKGIGILHFLIAAYIRCISMLPGANRFVAGRRIYARNDIEIVMTVKRSLSLDATETTIKVHFEPTDTIFDVFRKMNEKIEEIKASSENNNTEESLGLEVLVPLTDFYPQYDTSVPELVDIAQTWNVVLEEHGLMLSPDFPVGVDPDLFAKTAEIIGISSYLEALDAGIPFEDLFPENNIRRWQ